MPFIPSDFRIAPLLTGVNQIPRCANSCHLADLNFAPKIFILTNLTPRVTVLVQVPTTLCGRFRQRRRGVFQRGRNVSG